MNAKKPEQQHSLGIKAPDGFHRSFVVAVDAEAAWQAVARPVEGQLGRYNLPGFEAECSELESTRGKFLRLTKAEEPCKGTEIALVFEDSGNGTRITVVQYGFGPWLPEVIETFGMVWNHIVADLKLYIETGVQIKTHLFAEPPPQAQLGCKTRDALSGLEVTDVNAGGFCDRAGIKNGDLLVKLGGARLLNGLQLQSLLRVCTREQVLGATIVRDRRLLEVSAML